MSNPVFGRRENNSGLSANTFTTVQIPFLKREFELRILGCRDDESGSSKTSRMGNIRVKLPFAISNTTLWLYKNRLWLF